jgi:hypothetical protein
LLTASYLVDTFVVPEDYKGWNHFDTYNDLLSFEEDVCSLVDSVVVFLETAGSIAELGCLVKNDEIAPKLFVVANNDYGDDSFISLGMLKYLDSTFRDKINVISSQNANLSNEERDYIAGEIQKRFEEIPKTESFRVSHTRHVLYLIVDFIDLMQVARITDIQQFLHHLNILYPKRRLEQLLFALKNIGLVQEQKVLNERCLYLGAGDRPSIEYAFTSTTSKRLSWKANLFRKTMDDKWRTFAFKVLKGAQPKVAEEKKDAA